MQATASSTGSSAAAREVVFFESFQVRLLAIGQVGAGTLGDEDAFGFPALLRTDAGALLLGLGQGLGFVLLLLLVPAILRQPGEPVTRTRAPSRATIVGVIELSMRLPGATTLGGVPMSPRVEKA